MPRVPDGTESVLEQATRRFRIRCGDQGFVPLAGDVGQRRYFRCQEPGLGPVLVLYPEPHAPAQLRWTILRGALERCGVRVPRHLDDAPDLGAALIEDLGNRDLAAELEEADAAGHRRLLDEAERLLADIRQVPPSASSLNPPFDRHFFMNELAHTRTWALEEGGRTPLPAARAELWETLSLDLATAAAEETGASVPTHRDFHANNLMRAPDGRLAVIDFQDLRLGPSDYDPVSLRFERAGARAGPDPSRYSEAVLLERAWKVLGTFEKMLLWGREVYRPHREVARRVIRQCTEPAGRFAGLLPFLDGNAP